MAGGGKTLEEQVRDTIVNKFRRNGRAPTLMFGGKEIKINEYN
jgi:hypothetical protein